MEMVMTLLWPEAKKQRKGQTCPKDKANHAVMLKGLEDIVTIWGTSWSLPNGCSESSKKEHISQKDPQKSQGSQSFFQFLCISVKPKPCLRMKESFYVLKPIRTGCNIPCFLCVWILPTHLAVSHSKDS